jgi:poly(3-hydroxybutyrate) depolymerase
MSIWPMRTVVLAAGCLLLAACVTESLPSFAPGASTATASSSQDTPSPEPTPSVSPVPATDVPISVGGDKRNVRLFVPDLDAGTEAPLLVLLHGFGEAPTTMEMRVDAGVLAAREQVIVALPPGREGTWDALVLPGDDVTESPDVEFLAGMLDQLVDRYAVDPWEQCSPIGSAASSPPA